MNCKIDFINENTSRALVKMFIPLFMAMILTMIYSTVDSFWVGNMLGEQGISALTAGTAIVLILNSLSMGMGNGISVMLARMVGAEEKERIPGAVATILFLGAVISALLFLVSELLVDPLLAMLGTPVAIIADASLYLRIYLIGNIALFIYMQFTSVFRAFGDAGFQMKGMILTAVFNALADPLLISLYGLAGAAAATVVSEILCLIYAEIYHRRRRMFTIDAKAMKWEYGKEMFRLSIPTTIQAIMPAVSSAIMISFIAPFGMLAMAGYGVARNLELIMFMPTTGMCMAVTTIVGQCSGARRLDRARDYLKAGMLIGGVMIAVFSAAVILFSNALTGFFGQGENVAEIVRAFFHIISIGYVLYMLTSCMQGYITGLGKPGMAMTLLIMYYIIIRIPAAFFLRGCMGLNGIWFAFLISHVLAVVIAGMMTYKESAGLSDGNRHFLSTGRHALRLLKKN